MTHIEELKRIRSIFSAITGFDDNDDEYLWDARKAVEQLIDELEAQPQQEPVAHQYQSKDGVWRDFISQSHYEATVEDGSWPIRDLYTSPQPPQRKPLTHEQFQVICNRLSRQGGWDGDGWDLALKEAIEAAHGIKEVKSCGS